MDKDIEKNIDKLEEEMCKNNKKTINSRYAGIGYQVITYESNEGIAICNVCSKVSQLLRPDKLDKWVKRHTKKHTKEFDETFS